MSTEQETTPPATILINLSEPFKESVDQTLYIRGDLFDTARDALREIAKGGQSGDRLPFDTVVRMRRIASSALAAIDGKDGGG